MGKVTTTKPVLILLYGMPGSGKSFFSRQLCDDFDAAHLQADRIRGELFQKPTFSKEENSVITNLMAYMTGEFLRNGVNVVFDVNSARIGHRRILRNLASKYKAETVLVWLQIDPDTAFARASKRDRRTSDDHFAQEMTPETFRAILTTMQNPENIESHIVVSGKHVYTMQKNALFRAMKQRQLIKLSDGDKVSKPGLINLVPNPAAGRVDMSRRSINVR